MIYRKFNIFHTQPRSKAGRESLTLLPDMKRLSTFVLLFLSAAGLFGQGFVHDTLRAGGDRFFQPKKFNYSVTLGSQFTSVSGFGSALNTYVSPGVSYNLNKRLRIGGGISIIQTNYFDAKPYFRNDLNSGSSGNFTSAMVYVNDEYIVNDRLTISGSAFKQFPITTDPLPYNPFNPVSARGAQGINFNVNYRIGEHVFIQAGFRYSDGVNPYQYDPFDQNPIMKNPYGPGSMFGNPRW